MPFNFFPLNTNIRRLFEKCNEYCSISDVHLESSGSGSGSGGRETKSSLSVESGGSSRGGGGFTWTPPAGSAEGSTPTWTEGTPSFTESSSSGDAGKFPYALTIYYATWRLLRASKIPSFSSSSSSYSSYSSPPSSLSSSSTFVAKGFASSVTVPLIALSFMLACREGEIILYYVSCSDWKIVRNWIGFDLIYFM